MKYKRKPRNRNRKYIQLVLNHIEMNKKEYVTSVVIFIIGIIIGVLLINRSSEETQKSISGYITEFVQSIKSKEYEVDNKKLLFNSLTNNLRIAFIIWLAGSSIIGIPLVYGTVGYKGMCLGYSISAIAASLSKKNAFLFATSSMLLQNIIAIPCIIAISVSSQKMYKSIIKKRNYENIKFEIYRHSIFSGIMVIGLILSSIIEVCLSTNIMSSIILNFI